MADYWISQPRHFCEFCKCWIADNKPSRDFHEKGKKHQQNVQNKISEVLKKGQKAAKEKSEMDETMKQIEKAAIQALKKDLKQDPSLAAQYGVRIKPKESKETSKSEETNSTMKKDDSAKESTSSADQSKSDDTNAMWKEEWTPEGFVYYWHVETGESKWVKPDGYIPTWERAAKDIEQEENEDDIILEPATSRTREQDKQQTEEPEIKEQPIQHVPDKVAAPLPVDVGDIPLPASIPLPTVPQTEVSEEPLMPIPDVGPPTKSQATNRAATSAYGQWESITEETMLPTVDLQLPISSDAASVEVKIIPINEPKIKFRQKKVDTLGAEFVAFKKRKMAAGQKRSIRTTDVEKYQPTD